VDAKILTSDLARSALAWQKRGEGFDQAPDGVIRWVRSWFFELNGKTQTGSTVNSKSGAANRQGVFRGVRSDDGSSL
jgi:hypothetical protein